jgi:hypothetical protein
LPGNAPTLANTKPPAVVSLESCNPVLLIAGLAIRVEIQECTVDPNSCTVDTSFSTRAASCWIFGAWGGVLISPGTWSVLVSPLLCSQISRSVKPWVVANTVELGFNTELSIAVIEPGGNCFL